MNTAVCSQFVLIKTHYTSELPTAVRNYQYSSILSYVGWLRNAEVGESLLPPFLAGQRRTPHIECSGYGKGNR